MINMKKVISVALFLPVFCIYCTKTSPTISVYIVFASGAVSVVDIPKNEVRGVRVIR
jgi:hypothetical protein